MVDTTRFDRLKEAVDILLEVGGISYQVTAILKVIAGEMKYLAEEINKKEDVKCKTN